MHEKPYQVDEKITFRFCCGRQQKQETRTVGEWLQMEEYALCEFTTGDITDMLSERLDEWAEELAEPVIKTDLIRA